MSPEEWEMREDARIAAERAKMPPGAAVHIGRRPYPADEPRCEYADMGNHDECCESCNNFYHTREDGDRGPCGVCGHEAREHVGGRCPKPASDEPRCKTCGGLLNDRDIKHGAEMCTYLAEESHDMRYWKSREEPRVWHGKPEAIAKARAAHAAANELNLIAWALRAEHHRLSDRALRAVDILRGALT